MTNDLNLFTKDVGRYHLTYYPLNGNYAHIVTAERFKDDKLEIFDPQQAKLLLWEKLVHSMNLNKGIRVYRVDNLFVNTNYVNSIVLKD